MVKDSPIDRPSKDIGNYRRRVSQVTAAEQLITEAAEVSAGKNIGFSSPVLRTSVVNGGLRLKS